MRDGIRVPFSKQGKQPQRNTASNFDFNAFRFKPSQNQQAQPSSPQPRLINENINKKFLAEKGNFLRGGNTVTDLGQDFFSDEVPIDYIKQLQKLAVEYFNDE